MKKISITVRNFRNRFLVNAILVVFLETTGSAQIQPYGMVVQLRHNRNLPLDASILSKVSGLPPSSVGSFGFPRVVGGDRSEGANEEGFTWIMLETDPAFDVTKLPPGILFALRHSQNQANVTARPTGTPEGSYGNGNLEWDYINVAGRNPITDAAPRGMKSLLGSDIGADAGNGFHWFVTTGENFQNNWDIVDQLPAGTVIGLTHTIGSANAKKVAISWQDGNSHSAWLPSSPAPQGFVRMPGGDWGAGRDDGYFWYEKVSGNPPALPRLTASLVTRRNNGNVDWGFQLKNEGNGTVNTPFLVEMQVTVPVEPPSVSYFTVLVSAPDAAGLVPGGDPRTFPAGSTRDFPASANRQFSAIIIVDPHQKITQRANPGETKAQIRFGPLLWQ